jgi:predicted nucleic acid-binding protein
MLIERVAIDASPLIVLFKSRQSELLPQLFREIVVPPAVWREITQTKRQDEAAINLPKTPWINRAQEVAIAPEVAAKNLGKGETEILSFCLSNSKFAAIIDDRAARKCARTCGITTLGTGGVLLLAKRRGLLPYSVVSISHFYRKNKG